MRTRAVVDSEGGVQTESVDMVLGYPIASVIYHKLAHPLALRSIVVDGISPGSFIFAAKIVRGELARIVAFRSHVVVHNVHDDTEATTVCCIYQPLESVRAAIVSGW